MERCTFSFGAGTTTEYTAQTVTLHGDVINDNQGASGASGAGLRGCGMLSLGQDTWIFDAIHHGADVKDTIHWSGPSQLGTVVVQPNTVLSVRFVDDTNCDSLDILTDLIEAAPPCGGHLIGRAFSEISATLDSMNPVDSFFGLGLVIASGTNPYLGLTNIVRTSGYAPPNATVANSSSPMLPVLRYYRITTGAGPQSGTPNVMSEQVHCDELNGTELSQLHFWRSPDRGNTWAYSGITNYDAATDIFTWDTTVLGWPNKSGSFYWMLSEGYTDTPLPIVLQNFAAQRVASGVQLIWQTSSEINIAGFELDRDSELIASYWNDDSLRSRSPSGANYDYMDAEAPSGNARYDLYEITDDGTRAWLASQVAFPAEAFVAQGLASVQYTSGSLVISLSGSVQGMVSVSDAIGRVWVQQAVDANSSEPVTLPATLPAGFYFVSYQWEGGRTVKKLLISE